MLAQLVEYARRQGLVTEPGFAPKTVKWAIHLSESGEFLNVLELHDSADGKDPGRVFRACPDLRHNEIVGGSETRSHFMIDTAQVVSLLFKDAEDESRNGAKALSKHHYFLNLLLEASSAMPSLGPAHSALRDDSVLERIRSQMTGAKPGDKVTIAIGDRFPVDSDAWHDWWRDFRVSLSSPVDGGEGTMRCFVSGRLETALRTHPKISGLTDVGGLAMGDALVCFDKDAFRSFNLEQSRNCAVSEDAAAGYRAALNHLVKASGKPIAGARVVHWYSHDITSEDDWLSFIEDPSQEQTEASAAEKAKKLLNSIRDGTRPYLGDTVFYAIALSGGGGRVMVRDWTEGRFEDLVESVGRWFSDLEITSIGGNRLARDAGINRVINSMLLPKGREQKYGDWIKPVQSLGHDLWRSALQSERPIPFAALAKATVLNARFIQSGQLDKALDTNAQNGDRAAQLSLLQARIRIMKAYHVRRNGGRSELSAYLNEDHPSPAYHCGRIMAMLRRIQWTAQGAVGANIIQRYYGAASATPGLVLSRLVRLSQFHISKIGSKYGPGLSKWYDDRLALVWWKIRDSVPKSLTLEEQSLFALGYYQQVASDNANRPEKAVGVTDQQIDDIDNQEGHQNV